jgi:predicted transcriptional regulator
MYHPCTTPGDDGLPKVPNLKRVRESKFLTQQELAEKSGVSRPTIARLESPGDEARLSTVRKLAKALGVQPAALVADGD